MSGEDVKVLQAEVRAVSESTHRIEKAVEKNREETRGDIKRLHERLDEQINEQKTAIQRTDCEKYRSTCAEAQDKKIKEAKGVPLWVAGLISLCVGLIVFVATKGA